MPEDASRLLKYSFESLQPASHTPLSAYPPLCLFLSKKCSFLSNLSPHTRHNLFTIDKQKDPEPDGWY